VGTHGIAVQHLNVSIKRFQASLDGLGKRAFTGPRKTGKPDGKACIDHECNPLLLALFSEKLSGAVLKLAVAPDQSGAAGLPNNNRPLSGLIKSFIKFDQVLIRQNSIAFSSYKIIC